MTGSVKLDVTIRDREFRHKFFVTKAGQLDSDALVLGLDFGSMAGYIIDPEGPAVYFKDDYRGAISSCCSPDGGKPECPSVIRSCQKPKVQTSVG